MEYVLLYNDESQGCGYYYCLNDGMVYIDRKTVDKAKVSFWSTLGGLIGIIAYALVGRLVIKNWDGIVFFISIILLGCSIGVIISLILIRSTKRFFVEENRIEASFEDVCVTSSKCIDFYFTNCIMGDFYSNVDVGKTNML